MIEIELRESVKYEKTFLSAQASYIYPSGINFSSFQCLPNFIIQIILHMFIDN